MFLIRHSKDGIWICADILREAPVIPDPFPAGTGIWIRGRRLWSWSGALDTSTIAVTGCDGRAGPETTAWIPINTELCSVLIMSPAAVERLAALPVYRAGQ